VNWEKETFIFCGLMWGKYVRAPGRPKKMSVRFSWLLETAKRLSRQGVLGMNQRNARCILEWNPRRHFAIVDDKLQMHRLCTRLGVFTPAILEVIEQHAQLRRLPRIVASLRDFVIKPNHGAGGRGVLIGSSDPENSCRRHDGRPLSADDLRAHVAEILSGLYSLGGRPDQALIQERVCIHPVFDGLAYQGTPDIRVIVYRGIPVMAMLRLPTRASGGRANLHRGGIGAGIDLAGGWTIHAIQHNRPIDEHPDTGLPLVGLQVPEWDRILELSSRVAGAIELGYIGLDIVLDAARGPLLLEANARPGLAIQNANHRGLLPRLAEVDVRLRRQERGVSPVYKSRETALPMRKSA
jgi:alpha-L-glutamate ligase-like protein